MSSLRLEPPSAKKRSIWLAVTLAIVVALYFIGCNSVTLEMLRPG